MHLSVRKWKCADLLPLQVYRAYYLSRDVHFVHCMSSVQERKSIRPNISADGIYGGALLAVRSSECVCFYDWVECRLVRRIDVVAKVEDSDALLCDSLHSITSVYTIAVLNTKGLYVSAYGLYSVPHGSF